MYNIINKETFGIKTDIEKLSKNPRTLWAVLDNSIELYTKVLDEETGETITIPIYDSRYINTLIFQGTVSYKNLEYMNCIEIVPFKEQELEEARAKEAAKELLKTFEGKKLKIEADYEYLLVNYSFLVLYVLGKPSVKKHVNGCATILINEFKNAHYSLMQNDPNIIFTTFDGSDISNFIID